MKFLFDLFPVILFFTTFKFSEKHPDEVAAFLTQNVGLDGIAAAQAPILAATLVVIIATFIQIAWVKLRHGKVDKMLWLSLVLVVVFGGMTLIFKNEAFIKWKPTLLYWAFAASMGFASLVLKKNPMKGMLGEQVQLPEALWNKVNLAWIGFFLFMGAANLIVAFNFPTDVWVNFKLFGGMGLLLVFALAQGVVLSKYIEEK